MANDRTLHVLGVNHQTAPIEVREALALDAADAAHALALLRADGRLQESLVLSTCNRTELYVAAPPGVDPLAPVHDALRTMRPSATCRGDVMPRFALSGREAANHTFRVAAGLESAILGDTEIVRQLRHAFALARDAGTVGPHLDEVVRRALRAAKEARATTDISFGGAGVGSAVASLVGERSPTGMATVVLLGAGDAAQSIARAITKRGHRLVVANRTTERATELVHRLGGAAVPWADLDRVLPSADVIVAATSARGPVLTAPRLTSLAACHPGWSPLLIDAGVPRNIDPMAPGHVITIDGLREQEARARQRRAAALPAVEALLDRHLDAWAQWDAGRVVEGVIRDLYASIPSLSADVAGAVALQTGLARSEIEGTVRASVKRMLHAHVSRLREVAGSAPVGG